MELVKTEERDGIAIVSLAGGVTNPINLEVVEGLTTALSNALEINARGLVLTSLSDKFFSIGFDLPRLLDLGRDGVSGFYGAYNDMCLRLYTLPIPTITAITGHCVAGGCILAGMTDFRFMAQGLGKAGVNELKLGVPVPLLPTLVLTQMLGERTTTEMIYVGDLYTQERLEEVGFIDRIVPKEALLDQAVEFVKGIGEYPEKAFSISKSARTEGVKLDFIEKREEDTIKFLDCWSQEKTKALLLEASKKF